MSINEYIFQGQWHFISDGDLPPNRRVLLSNGDAVVIGTLTKQGDTIHCIFDRDDLTGYNPIAWMELPLTSPLGKS